MKNPYYVLCAIPAVCFFISWMVPGNFNEGSNAILFLQIGLLGTVILLSPILVAMGLWIIYLAKMDGKPIGGLCLATAIASLPGILFLMNSWYSNP